MVNLGESINSNESDDNISTTYSRQVLLQPVVGTAPKLTGYIPTTLAAIFFFLLTVILGVLTISMTVVSQNDIVKFHKCDIYYFMLYIRAIYWVISHVIDAYIRKKHVNVRIDGYLDFYHANMKVARAPHYVNNLFNVLLLTLASVIHHYYGDLANKCKNDLINPVTIIAAVLTLEGVIVSCLLLVYVGRVQSFNKQNLPPDALRDEWMARFIRNSFNEGEVGYREHDDYVKELLEKQADLIRHLKEQNSRLIQKVVILSTQLQERHAASVT